jgi:hypothetical protein
MKQSTKTNIETAILGIFVALAWWGIIYFYVLVHEVIIKP